MRFLHSMVRVRDLEGSLRFFTEGLGLQEVRRKESERGKFTLVFLSSGAAGDGAEIELTYNWEGEENDAGYTNGRNFGHLAFAVPDIYAACERLQSHGVAILRPPRDGRMAFVKSPDGISIELLQAQGALEPKEPWSSMPNQGNW